MGRTHWRDHLPVALLFLETVNFRLANAIALLRAEPSSAFLLEAGGYFTAVVLMAFALPRVMPGLADDPLPPKWVAVTLIPVALATVAVTVRLAGFDAWRAHEGWRVAALFGDGLLYPMVYGLYFLFAPPGRRGTWFGARNLLGLVVIHLAFAAIDADDPTQSLERMRVLFTLRTCLLAVEGIVLVLTAHWAWERCRDPIAIPVGVEPESNYGGAAPKFAALAGMFFIMNGFLQMRISPYWNDSDETLGAVPVASAIACLLVGVHFDRRALEGCKAILRAFAIAFMLAPALDVLSAAPGTLRFLSSVLTVWHIAAMVAIACALAIMARPGRWYLVAVCSPHFLQMLSLLGRWLFRETLGLDSGLIVLITIIISMSMYFMSGRILRTPPPPDVPAPPPPPPAPEDMFKAYGLSPRESEVAALLLQGCTTRTIAHRLDISENTVATHVKNLLPKFGVSTRKAFLAMMAGGLAPAVPPARPSQKMMDGTKTGM